MGRRDVPTTSSSGPKITVSEPPRRFPSGSVDGARPAHHLDGTMTKFGNPWPSFRYQSAGQWVSAVTAALTGASRPKIPDDIKTLVPSQHPTWGNKPGNEGHAKATWLGHAGYLLELPTPEGAARGPRIIFDPVFSNRCAPSQWIGPARYTDAPCKVEEIPAVDVIILSHNHYDHTDLPTLNGILANPSSSALIFVGLNNAAHLSSALKLPLSRVHDLDWWDERLVRVALPAASAGAPPVDAEVRLTCTPSQHVSGRTAFDRWAALWAAWVVEEVRPGVERGKRLYFAGDTGYRTVRDGEDEESVPVCPVFAEVGERFGGVDLALLPIGAYSPRAMWSNLHGSPADAVRMFRDVKAKRALAMHWGTWVLTSEPVMEPPQLLRKECEKAGVTKDEFLVPGLGETVLF
ncbi:N-acyl-phosphatidylethanolamine-hydrolyzing phospholipase D [Auriscalpium vulgare]|uniref:N-acyl-phosphatidylethanolamine-hydrolyzing phospholipase D n=1 Tax=Auriscalpium vulgare TaxID=40419 RepID=A0ACB8S4K6_9AGAM|nr:N-acyl-phosphatidylethanolamine-hydrolyzing phospholipase D [Auriscalpium vulgare]